MRSCYWRVINDMLNLARLESERVELSKQSLNLGELITGVVEMVQLQAERRHIVITSDVEPDMPRLYADRGLMETVIKNLVDNAVKFSDDGGHVRVTAREVGTSLMFMVEDEGIGIPQDSIPQLFTKFYRVPSTDAAAVQGTGLGLALAREAVMAHGGRIEVESQLGEGSRFTVTVPQGGYLSLEMHDATAEQLGRAVVQRQQ